MISDNKTDTMISRAIPERAFGIKPIVRIRDIEAVVHNFLLFKKQADYAVYTFPTIQMIFSIFIVLLVCLLTPLIIYKSLVKDSIVERLRDN